MYIGQKFELRGRNYTVKDFTSRNVVAINDAGERAVIDNELIEEFKFGSLLFKVKERAVVKPRARHNGVVVSYQRQTAK